MGAIVNSGVMENQTSNQVGNIPTPGAKFSKDSFITFLQKREGQSFYLKPYLGNSGDELICRGCRELLSGLGIQVTLDPRVADVILWPGGNPTMWQPNVDGWVKAWEAYPSAEFVVAPATFQFGLLDWAKKIRENPNRVTGLFARDAASYENLKKADLPKGVEIGVSNDPALHLKETPWMAALRGAATADYVLVAFRDDHESNGDRQPWVTIFMSLMPARLKNRIQWSITQTTRSRKIEVIRKTLPTEIKLVEWDISMANFEVFIEVVRSASVVHTDRLHVMLLAVMLGKPVVAYETAYGKLEAVYEQSLKGWANVTFVSSAKAS